MDFGESSGLPNATQLLIDTEDSKVGLLTSTHFNIHSFNEHLQSIYCKQIVQSIAGNSNMHETGFLQLLLQIYAECQFHFITEMKGRFGATLFI